jgi:hypothetical protein
MSRPNTTWTGNWRARIRSRLEALGYQTIAEFLAQHRAEPYLQLAARLGEDVAAIQVQILHCDDAREKGNVRAMAMDSLARDLRTNLAAGWSGPAKGDFDTSGAYADWVSRLEVQLPGFRPVADATWQALEQLTPPTGWQASGPHDPVIVAAFARGWPETEGKLLGADSAGESGAS